MSEFRLPPIQAVIDLHSELIRDFGGAPGLRDRGMLEGSLGRASQIMAHEPDASTAVAAAAVCASIRRNHPFVDGNKRAAFSTLGVILGMNGLYLDVSEGDATRIMLSLAAGALTEEEFPVWVADNVTPATP